MPELPEVETVKRTIEPLLLNQVFETPIIYCHRLIQTGEETFSSLLPGKKVLSLSRKGKYLLLHLSGDKKLIFHLRMEGKLYLVDKERHEKKHLSMLIPLKDNDDALAFYDVRKFGCAYLLNEEEEGPLKTLGKELFDMDPNELYFHFQKSKKPVKELLMDQTIIAGLGNIYADETCFRAKISPFKKANELTFDEVRNILAAAKNILNQAIDHHGSTIRTYRASQSHAGEFQDKLYVYGREGKICSCCKKYHIEKRKLSGRGTSYCPNCQNTGINIAVTGKIASGKSLATSYFKEEGFVTFSADDEVKKMYSDPIFLEKLKVRFPEIFTPKLNKKKIQKLLTENPQFRRKYQQVIFQEIKEKVNAFIIAFDGKDKAFEIPLLFDAHMEKNFTYLVGVETTKQEEHLKERGEDVTRKDFNRLNSYDLHRKKLDFILCSDGTKEELHKQVKDVICEMKSI